jgi:tetratricopeptide (TPR) repeat protein
MKIAVYAIAKNEEAFVERFCESAKEADLVLIADTGSTDNTVQKAREHGAEVHTISVKPWRFDKARDAALALVPADIDVCVSLDLDEVLEPGWRQEVEKLWTEGVTRVGYMYQWSKENAFYYDKIHARHGYFWKHACHEYVYPDPRTVEKLATTGKVLVTHYPDPTKSRSNYLELLRAATQENKYCQRMAFYFARELMYTQKWEEGILAAQAYLSNPEATWDHERACIMRMMATAHQALERPNMAAMWARRACAEVPNCRDPWMTLARIYYAQKDWQGCYTAAMRCLGISTDVHVHTRDPAAWGPEPHDLAALAAYYTGRPDEAIEHGKKALELDPGNPRLIDNLAWYTGEKLPKAA